MGGKKANNATRSVLKDVSLVKCLATQRCQLSAQSACVWARTLTQQPQLPPWSQKNQANSTGHLPSQPPAQGKGKNRILHHHIFWA